ncbi:helix-turn-helix domain-containing protein [Actinokineospora globicatena]|uniref:helix-turn-helix domain-containing protein n=1 Tax=Actinokineospora globicatena TaxID=103729 RepID=UPI0020A3751F|nr:helix-turn-helix transcriptional regulator [Actinokineospora globicatena]MCP2303201.1 hypothetical protein [Actinokineospora globicatena]GLW79678.1 hypothetical protein Aglo01_41590 [Actinokineospora globicatena]GLW85912.1 hypothetical protein Aglo02_35520 [Actinokineospora globicatena]
MAEDWAAVARVINERADALGLRQRELAERSQVSQAIVRELQLHIVERRRSARTLEALSVALGLHPQHLDAVLNGQTPPAPDPVVTRLDTLERRVTEIAGVLDSIQNDLRAVLRNTGRQ